MHYQQHCNLRDLLSVVIWLFLDSVIINTRLNPTENLAANTLFYMVSELVFLLCLSHASTAISSTSGATMQPALLAVNHFVTIKLNRDNYLLWKAQLIPYLRSQGLLGCVNGSVPTPLPTTTHTVEGNATQIPNPAYLTWFQQDQIMLSAILSSLTEEILSHVLFKTTSTEV